MLILTRRPGEAIDIGSNIAITVLGVVGNQVRFGIDAPKSVSVDRREIRERKEREIANLSPNSSSNPKGEPNGNR